MGSRGGTPPGDPPGDPLGIPSERPPRGFPGGIPEGEPGGNPRGVPPSIAKKRNDAENRVTANYPIGFRFEQRVYCAGSPHRLGSMALARLQADVEMLASIVSSNTADLEFFKRKAEQHFKYSTWVVEGTESIELLYHNMVEEAGDKGLGWPALKDQLVWALVGEMAEHMGLKWPLQPGDKKKNGERDTVVKVALAELYEALWRGPGGKSPWAEVVDVSEGDGEGDPKKKASEEKVEEKEREEERCCAAEVKPADKDKALKGKDQSQKKGAGAEKGQGLAAEVKEQEGATNVDMDEDGAVKEKEESIQDWKRTRPQHIIQNVYPRKYRPGKTPGTVPVRKPFVFMLQLEPGHRALEAAKVMSDVMIDALRHASGMQRSGGMAGQGGKQGSNEGAKAGAAAAASTGGPPVAAKKRFLMYFETPKSEKDWAKGKAAKGEAKGMGGGKGSKGWTTMGVQGAFQKGGGCKGKQGGKTGGVKGAFGGDGKGGKGVWGEKGMSGKGQGKTGKGLREWASVSAGGGW